MHQLQVPEMLEQATEVFTMGIASMWSSALKKLSRKFTDYAHVLARCTSRDRWRQTARDAFLLATRKCLKKVGRTLSNLARQVFMVILEAPIRALASEIASKFESVASQLGLPAELTNVVEPSVRCCVVVFYSFIHTRK